MGGRKKIKLSVVENPDAKASILAPSNKIALFVGDETETLICGKCRFVLVKGVSRETLRARFAAPAQLLLKCPKCGAHNRLPAQIGN